jgi:RNA recognition motif-containing protein
MGLDRFQKTPCGFCFVEYFTHQQACDCMRFINGTKLDERVVRTDLDPGFKEGRQYGRGKSGGQVRDEYRRDYDPSRGGWGRLREPEPAARPEDEVDTEFQRSIIYISVLIVEPPQSNLGKRRRGSDDEDGRESPVDGTE